MSEKEFENQVENKTNDNLERIQKIAGMSIPDKYHDNFDDISNYL